MQLKDISFLELWQPFCSAERNPLCNLEEGIIRNIHVKLFEIWISVLGGRMDDGCTTADG